MPDLSQATPQQILVDVQLYLEDELGQGVREVTPLAQIQDTNAYEVRAARLLAWHKIQRPGRRVPRHNMDSFDSWLFSRTHSKEFDAWTALRHAQPVPTHPQSLMQLERAVRLAGQQLDAAKTSSKTAINNLEDLEIIVAYVQATDAVVEVARAWELSNAPWKDFPAALEGITDRGVQLRTDALPQDADLRSSISERTQLALKAVVASVSRAVAQEGIATSSLSHPYELSRFVNRGVAYDPTWKLGAKNIFFLGKAAKVFETYKAAFTERQLWIDSWAEEYEQPSAFVSLDELAHYEVNMQLVSEELERKVHPFSRALNDQLNADQTPLALTL